MGGRCFVTGHTDYEETVLGSPTPRDSPALQSGYGAYPVPANPNQVSCKKGLCASVAPTELCQALPTPELFQAAANLGESITAKPHQVSRTHSILHALFLGHLAVRGDSATSLPKQSE